HSTSHESHHHGHATQSRDPHRYPASHNPQTQESHSDAQEDSSHAQTGTQAPNDKPQDPTTTASRLRGDRGPSTPRTASRPAKPDRMWPHSQPCTHQPSSPIRNGFA